MEQLSTMQTYSWLNPISRGTALFLGGFTLLNVLRQILGDDFNANIWWIDLTGVADIPVRLFFLLFSLALLSYAIRPAMRPWRRQLTTALIVIAGIAVLWNIAMFYQLLVRGTIESGFPVPFSIFVLAALTLILSTYRGSREPVNLNRRQWMIPVTTIACLIIFPMMQILCFGQTDYRRNADAVVVLGAKAYPDGVASIPLADRVSMGVQLYKEGLAGTLIFSGGPIDESPDRTEPDVMKSLAMRMGVPAEAIMLDANGLNTRATARNTVGMFRQAGIHRVMVVSNFYHLPRIKMTYQQEGWQVYTVPAHDRVWSATPYQVLREVFGLWAYYSILDF